MITDEGRRRAYLARLEDTLTQFPQVDGAILDGPEWGYEIDPNHRSYLFADLPPGARRRQLRCPNTAAKQPEKQLV